MSSRTFEQLDLKEFDQILELFPWRRRVSVVHLHHTWRPNHAQYRGLATIVGMWRYHTTELGWSDIAQHLTIGPDGELWSGRDWNRPPASASGFNGNASVGPFMIEMVGDFDHGRDPFGGKQKAAVIQVVALLHERFDLDDTSLVFHSALSGKTCPGTAIDRQALVGEIGKARGSLRQRTRQASARRPSPFGDRARSIHRVIRSLENGEIPLEETAAAEIPETLEYAFAGDGRRDGSARRFDVTPEVLSELRPHVINLTQGRLSSGGAARTDAGDVRAIFATHLPRALEAARAASRPLHVVFYAHGGLVSEKSGLAVAYKHLEWWRQNGVYPINFVWETGLWETLRALGRSGRERGARGLDLVPDRLVEALLRRPGGRVWSGMKRSAERAVDPPGHANAAPETYGGARFALERLQAFLAAHAQADIRLHAVGHSAGAIFHSHFLPAALDVGIRSFASTQLLAPAITVEAFEARLAPLGDRKIGPLTVFTMQKAFELDDEVAEVYDRSLLYLIHRALEPRRETPILGLEVSLRESATLRKLFALDGGSSRVGEVVWSPTATDTGRRASRATTHGGFDDDAPTMNSVVRGILGRTDDEPVIDVAPFLSRSRAAVAALADGPDIDLEDADLVAELRRVATRIDIRTPHVPTVVSDGRSTPRESAIVVPPAPRVEIGGRRRALCVGIDRYPSDPLNGCVADARMWAETLERLGFESPELLLDRRADRDAILDGLRRLVAGSAPGDVLVFQYSGHGTQLPDLDADEDDAQDEALCSIDWEDGQAVIDDDLAEIFAGLQAGVNLTLFMDCCHSGTNTRVAAARPAARPPDTTARARYVVASPEIRRRYVAARSGGGSNGDGGSNDRRDGRRGPESMREVSFAACQPWEVAWESGGHGEFTVRATELLLDAAGRVTHEEFERRVRRAFGRRPRQLPLLDCAPRLRGNILLEPLESTFVGSAGVEREMPLAAQAEVVRLLRAIADTMD